MSDCDHFFTLTPHKLNLLTIYTLLVNEYLLEGYVPGFVAGSKRQTGIW